MRIRSVTVDLDDREEPPILAGDALYVRRSSGGRGLHLLGFLDPTRSHAPVECFSIREALGDDPLRLKMDAYRWSVTRDPHYLRGILFDRKRGRSAGPWLRVGTWRRRGAGPVAALVVRRVAALPGGRTSRRFENRSAPFPRPRSLA